MRSKIIGLGSAVPEKVLTNNDLSRMVDTSDEWITTRTGIKVRHICGPDEATSDLALSAARRALAAAQIDAQELDLIILATVTGDLPFPATSCLLQKELGAVNAAAFDLSAACSGYVYGLVVADQFIRSGAYKHILLIGADTFSKIVDWEDRSTCVLFGDGASAAVVTASDDESGLLDFELGCNGEAAHLLLIPAGGSREPITEKVISQRRQYVKMQGAEVFKLAVKSMVKVIRHVLEKNNLTADDLSLIVPHQANVRILEATAHKLKLASGKMFANIDKYGNTSAASVGLALEEALSSRRAEKGELVLLVAFGGGFSWGAALIRL